MNWLGSLVHAALYQRVPEFREFKKIPRLYKECVITEKIDGTNAQILIEGDKVYAGSRTKWLTPGKRTDNFGFAQWVKEHEKELLSLGEGRHYGEWYGQGIQRKYGLDEKRLALFDQKWGKLQKEPEEMPYATSVFLPKCCSVVPVLYEGQFTQEAVDYCMERLTKWGSKAVNGFMKPEGIVIYHKASKQLFKYTFGGDGK